MPNYCAKTMPVDKAYLMLGQGEVGGIGEYNFQKSSKTNIP